MLARALVGALKYPERTAAPPANRARTVVGHKPSGAGDYVSGIYRERVTLSTGRFAMIDEGLGFQLVPWRPALDQRLGQHIRSEEHTSELQSLMRISYAVFCLKKHRQEPIDVRQT